MANQTVHKSHQFDLDQLRDETQRHHNRNMIILGVCFSFGVGLLIWIYSTFPPLTEDELKVMKFPSSGAEIQDIANLISHYTDRFYPQVLSGFCALYIFLQAFAIPGPLILSILSGALFGGVIGFVMVSLCATCGACACYLMSDVFAKSLIIRSFPDMIVRFNVKIRDNTENLIYYLLFLRITPILPNWFINISTPIVGVSFTQFLIATFLGLIPANIIHVRTGMTLSEIQKVGFDPKALLGLFVLGCFALIPTLIKRKYEEKSKQE
mmetsp:Transcript_52490/g.60038  ORF Transcript_52490/g.60038 Transcript_52490/m.60038 type:complete len:267 (-) Transcript_52490:87-887(-)